MKKSLITIICLAFMVKPVFSQNVGINSTGATPDGSAMLDVSSANKGMLIPRIALTGVNDLTTIVSPTTSLLVYNTETVAGTNGVFPSYYYFDGTKWVYLMTSNTVTDSTHDFWIDSMYIRNGDTKMIIKDNGNVGVGMTNPKELLDVNGVLNIAKDSSILIGYQNALTTFGGSGETYVGTTNGINTTAHVWGNTAVGALALNEVTTAGDNTAVGVGSLFKTTTGRANVAVGSYALIDNVSGRWNVAVGDKAMKGSTGELNVALGYRALQENVSGGNNVAIGQQAGRFITSGSNNIMIGAGAGPVSNTGSNQLNIGNTIYGNLGTDYIGIGVVPKERLHVNANNDSLQFDNLAGTGNALFIDGNGKVFKDKAFLADSAEWKDYGDYILARRAAESGDTVAVTDNGSVGIGTTNPTSNLHIQSKPGNSGHAGIIIENIGIGPSDDALLQFKEQHGISLSIGSDVNDANNIPAFMWATKGLRIGGGTTGILGTFSEQGYFGVGAILPQTRFHINGASDYSNSSELDDVVATVAGDVGIGTRTPTSKLEVNGSFATAILSTTASVTLSNIHHTVIVTGGTPIITLPSAVGISGRIYVIVNQTATGVSTGITYKHFTGAAVNSIPFNSAITVQSDGMDWHRIK